MAIQAMKVFAKLCYSCYDHLTHSSAQDAEQLPRVKSSKPAPKLPNRSVPNRADATKAIMFLESNAQISVTDCIQTSFDVSILKNIFPSEP